MAANKLGQAVRAGRPERVSLALLAGRPRPRERRIRALLGEGQRHGYEIGQLIASRSEGAINFHITSLYPTLYRLENRGLIEGRWVERAGQRRRRYYKPPR